MPANVDITGDKSLLSEICWSIFLHPDKLIPCTCTGLFGVNSSHRGPKGVWDDVSYMIGPDQYNRDMEMVTCVSVQSNQVSGRSLLYDSSMMDI